MKTTADGFERLSEIDGGLFCSPLWREVLEAEYGFRFERIETQGTVIPYVLVDDARGPRHRSLPFSDMAPLLVDDGWQAALNALGDIPSQLWTVHDGPAPDGWIKDQPCVWQRLDVAVSEETELVQRCRATVRNRVRRSQRLGFVVDYVNSANATDDFYQLHLGVRRHKHGLLPQGRSLFHHIRESFATDHWVVRVRRDDVTEAAAVVLSHGDSLYYKYSASRPAFRSDGVNQALVLGIADLAHRLGRRWVDLGRSDLDPPGLVAFKEGFGAESIPLFRYQTTTPNATSHVDAGRTLGQLTELLVQPEVPDAVVEQAGALIYRLFA